MLVDLDHNIDGKICLKYQDIGKYKTWLYHIAQCNILTSRCSKSSLQFMLYSQLLTLKKETNYELLT